MAKIKVDHSGLLVSVDTAIQDVAKWERIKLPRRTRAKFYGCSPASKLKIPAKFSELWGDDCLTLDCVKRHVATILRQQKQKRAKKALKSDSSTSLTTPKNDDKQSPSNCGMQ